jgi:uncharacterized membrane protein YGL010W
LTLGFYTEYYKKNKNIFFHHVCAFCLFAKIQIIF